MTTSKPVGNKAGNWIDTIEVMARMANEAGEGFEDISESVFAHIFNYLGQDPEQKEWAMNASDSIMKKLIEEEHGKETLQSGASELLDAARAAIQAIRQGEPEIAVIYLNHGIDVATGKSGKGKDDQGV